MTLDLPLWAALPAALFLIAGGLATLIGALGLLRLKSFYDRMHPPTMCTTLGAGCALVASMLTSSALVGGPVIHEVLLIVFLFIAAPISAILLMRAAIYRGTARTKTTGDSPGGAPH